MHELPVDPRHRWLITSMGVAGGAAVIAGAAMPWLSVFAGLHSYPGLAGRNGQLLAATGVVTMLIAFGYGWHGRTALRYALGAAGFVLSLAVAYLLAQLWVTYHALHDMFLPALGPGLFVAAAGALAVTATMFVRDASSRRRQPAERSGIGMAALAAGAGAIHLSVAAPHLGEYALYGVFFVGVGIAQIGWSVAVLLFGPTRWLRLSAIANLLVVGLWAASRTIGLPIGPPSARPEAVGFADVAATVFELALLVLVARARRPGNRLGRWAWALPLGVPPITVIAILAGVTSS
jgi:hypothetical protein